MWELHRVGKSYSITFVYLVFVGGFLPLFYFDISKYLKLAGHNNLLSISASLCYSIMTSSYMGLLSSAVDNQETDREETESDQESVSWSHLL